jgi:predicted ATPase
MDDSTLFGSALDEFEDAIQRFEDAWRGMVRPEILAYLPAGAGRFRLLNELVHVDLEYRLQAGETVRVEDYLDRYPELAADNDATIDLIAAEFSQRARSDPGLGTADYVQRFPQFGEQLAGRIAAITVGYRSAATARLRKRPTDRRAPELPVVPGYEVIGPLGRGGMGVIYTARQVSLGRLVALKFLPDEYARDPVWLERFRREAITASALNHPHICTIYDSGECGGRPFLSLELVEGRTLAELIDDRPPAHELARLIGQAARALAAAHAAGVVHRDIKPSNLMARTDGIVKVLDFGLARRLPVAGGVDPNADTDPGTRVGTLLYMSPEQARGEPVGTPSDIFSLGIVLYELATGQHPFESRTEVGIIQAILERDPVPVPLLNPDAPAALDTLVQRMLAKDPRLRPAASDVDRALAELATPGSGPHAVQLDAQERPVTVGRNAEREVLRGGFETATRGRGSMVCVTGEPGLGKTTFVEDFLEELACGEQPTLLARGRCSERLAGTEAYLPILEALESLLQGVDGAETSQVMKVVAPSWYVQLAPLAATEPGFARVMEDAKAASQERRKRELTTFLQEVSRRRTLVVFLDDVHWADPSSVDLLAYLGGKCAGLRLLLVLTYRPSDLALSKHPFGPVKLELQGRGICREIALPFLSADDFDRYLALIFAGHQFPHALTGVLHTRTEGNPLFMVDLLRYLRDRGVIVQDDGCWALVRDIPDLERELPESVRGMIQRKVGQLSAADRHLLMAASVQGPEFDSAVVARLLGRDAAHVEDRLNVLERIHYLVRPVREHAFPDGTLTVRYRFVHVLYQNALYAALQPTRKAAWSAAAASALLEHHGEMSAGLAAELALLFEAGRDYERAADYYRIAAENAARIFAPHEAAALARRGLGQLSALPETPDRARRELPLQTALGMQLQIAQGFAAPEARRIYQRARMLHELVPDAQPLLPVLWGLWMFHEVRGEPGKSLELAKQLFTLSQNADDPARLILAHQALTITSLCLGEPAAARDHMVQGMALYDRNHLRHHTYLYGQDPGVGCLAFGAVALWLLGYPDQAVQRSREAIALGEESGQPSTLALALHLAAILQQHLRMAAAVQATADVIADIATEHGFSFWQAGAKTIRGWALAEQGESASGVAHLCDGLDALFATGAQTYRTYYRALLADALGRDGNFGDGLGVLNDALAHMDHSGERFQAAELNRLRGEFLRQLDPTRLAFHESEACFRRAITIARQQHAKSFELRAVMSLARLYQTQDRQAEVKPMLAECYGWFNEGLETHDLQDAKALLEQIS